MAPYDQDKVSVARRDVVTINVDIDMPEAMLAAMRDAMRGEGITTQIVVNVGGNKVGTVNPFARQWRHYTDRMETY